MCRLNAPLSEKKKNQFTSTVLAVDGVGLKPLVLVFKQVFLEDGSRLSDSSLLDFTARVLVSTGLVQLTLCYTSGSDPYRHSLRKIPEFPITILHVYYLGGI